MGGVDPEANDNDNKCMFLTAGLVYRCLQAVILLIPDLREYFRSFLSKQHNVLLTQFDRLLQDYQTHCRELAKKLKTIMEDGFIKHLSKVWLLTY